MTEELKKLLARAKIPEEARAIIEAHKDDLTDEELANIEGGLRKISVGKCTNF